MKKIIPLTVCLFAFMQSNYAQINADIDGKTVTDEIQITTGASNGYILQCDGVGNGTWVNPALLSSASADWNMLVNIPPGFSDGVDDVNDADSSPLNELIGAISLSGTTLIISEAASIHTLDLAPIQDGVDDADNIVGNEYNTSMGLNGSTLELVDGGSTLTADLSALQLSLWQSFGNTIYYDAGYVGVGIQPIAPMSIKGSTGFASSNDEAYSLLVDDTGNLSFHANNMLGTGTPTLTLDDSNFKRIGLGIATPEEKLHLASGGVRMDETQTDPAPKTAYGNSMPVAYGYFAGTSISTDYGIANIANPSTGVYTVTLDNNFSGAPVVMITSFNSVPGAEIATYSYTAPNIITVNIVDETGTARNSNFSLVVFGTPE